MRSLLSLFQISREPAKFNRSPQSTGGDLGFGAKEQGGIQVKLKGFLVQAIPLGFDKGVLLAARIVVDELAERLFRGLGKNEFGFDENGRIFRNSFDLLRFCNGLLQLP